MRKSVILFLAAVLVPLVFYASDDGIVITKTAKQENPSVAFTGVSGNQALSAAVFSDLRFCGWFRVVKSKSADYLIGGSADSSNRVTLSVTNSAGIPVASVSGHGKTPEWAAHEAVDAVLNALFNVKGICRSKIVFAVDTAPGKKEIYMCGFDGRSIEPVTRNGTLSVSPSWLPGGDSIVYTFYGSSYTHLIQFDFASRRSRRLSRYKGLNTGGAVSPDGKYLAMVLAIDNQVDLYVRPIEGTSLTRITNDKAVEASPCWSPDGRSICFVSDARGGRPRLFLADARGGNVRRIAGLSGSEQVTPCFSKDGKLLYSAKLGGSYVPSASILRGSGAETLELGNTGRLTVSGEGPCWAPDNRHFAMFQKGVIYIVDSRLGTMRRLLGGTSKVYQPAWSPILKER